MKNKILELYHKHQFTRFGDHNELFALVVCADNFYDDNEKWEFDELIFAVEKEWLINYLNEHKSWIKWDGAEVQGWLQNEYSSDDSYAIFYEALSNSQVVMLEFN